jgi:hypothetical protein
MKGEKTMAIDITKVCKANHHQLSAIMNRVEKAKAEKLAQQNPPKKPA